MKENDYLLNALSNPDFSNVDFANVGLNANNTSIESKDTYKKLNYIQSNPIFQTDGKFDETKFDEFYDAALVGYNRFSSDLTARDVAKQISYYKGDIFAPVLQRNLQPEFKIEKVATNPDRQKKSAWGVNMYSNPTMSRREIALSLLVYDDVNKEWKESPNDGGFFGNFGNTLVLATWDSDGTHTDPITGLLVNHKKGTPKLNENGTYYYEPLGNRDIYGKEVLSNFDVITTDGSTWNKYDFLDSDDLEKSLTGTLVRNIIKVAPAFIPYVAPWYLAGRIGLESVDLFSKLGKMTFGSDSPTLSALEGFSKSMELSSSDHAQQHPWSLESILNLSADVFTQLAEQRWLFEYAPSLLKGNKLGFSKKAQVEFTDAKKAERLSEIETNLKELNRPDVTILQVLSENGAGIADAVATANRELEAALKSNYKLGEYLSKAYMTGITVADSYGEAIHNGASDMEAALFTLGYAIGEYGILNTQLGEWIMPELRIEKQRLNAAIRALAKQPPLLATQAKKATWIGEVIQAGKDWWSGEMAGTGKRMGVHMLSNALGEGFEEVSEEALQDFSKALFNASRYLAGDSTRLTPTWQGEDGKFNLMNTLNDYALNFVGGFIGGGIGNLKTVYNQATKMPDFSGDDGRKNAFKELVYYIREGKGKEIKSLASKLRLGDANKSVEIVPLSQGGFQFAAGTKENNLDTFVKKTFNQFVDKILEIINLERDVKTESEIQVDLILKDLRFQHLLDSKVLPDYLQDYHNEVSNLTALSLELDRILKDKPDSGDFTPEQQKKIADLEEKIKKSRKILEEYVDGTQGKEFIKDGIFEMEYGLSSGYFPTTVELYIQLKDYLSGHDRNISEIPEDLVNQYTTEFENFKNTNYKELLHYRRKLFDYVNNKFSTKLQNHVNEYLNEDPNSYVQTVEESTIGEDPEGKKISIVSAIETLPDLTLASKMLNAYLATSDNSFTNNYNKQVIFTGALINSIRNNSEYRKIYEAIRLLEAYSPDNELGLVDSEGKLMPQDILDTLSEFNYPHLIGRNVDDPAIKYSVMTIKNDGFKLLNKLLSEILNNDLADVINAIKQSNFIKTSTREYLRFLVDNFADLKDAYYDAINSIKYTPIDELLDSLKMISSKNDLSISDLIKKYTKLMSEAGYNNTLPEFGIDEEDYKSIKNALELTKILFSHLSAARTDNLNYESPFGYNVTVNELVDGSELVTYDVNTFNILALDLSKTQNELKLFLKLIETNTDSLLNKLPKIDAEKTFKMAEMIRKVLTVNIPDDWEGKSEFIKGIQEVTEGDLKSILFTPDGSKKILIVINEKAKITLLKEKIKLNTLIYNFFLKNKNKSIEDFLKVLGNASDWEINNEFNLHNESDNFDSEDKEPSIRIVFAFLKANSVLKYSDFLAEYKNVLSSDLPYAYASGIENSVFHQRAHIIEKALQNKFDEVYNNIISQHIKLVGSKTLPLYYNSAESGHNTHSHLLFKNTHLVEGGPGTGKSTANTATLLTLAQANPEITKKIFLVHTTLDRAEAWRDRLIKQIPSLTVDNFQCFSHDSYVKHINSERHTVDPNEKHLDLEKLKLVYSSEDKTPHYSFEESGMVYNNGTPSLVLIDEVTKIGLLDLSLHEKYIDHLNVRSIAYGDFSQGSYQSELTTEKGTDSIFTHRNNFSGTYKLTLSFRSDNKYLVDAILNIELTNKEIFNKLVYGEFNDTTGVFDALQDEVPKIKSNYHLSDDGLFGIKIIKSEDLQLPPNKKLTEVDENSDFAKTVKIMLNTLHSDDDYITYVSTNPNSVYTKYMIELRKIYGKKISIVEGQIQGDEGQYYIIETITPDGREIFPLEDDSAAAIDDAKTLSVNYAKTLYTNLSRSLQGTLFVVTDIDPDKLYEESESRPLPGTFRLSETAIKKANDTLLNIINLTLEGIEVSPVEVKNVPSVNPITSKSENNPDVLKNDTVDDLKNKAETFVLDDAVFKEDGESILNELKARKNDGVKGLDDLIDRIENKLNSLTSDTEEDESELKSDVERTVLYDNTQDPDKILAHLYSFNAYEPGVVYENNRWVVLGVDEDFINFYDTNKAKIKSKELSNDYLDYLLELNRSNIDITSIKGLILTGCVEIEIKDGKVFLDTKNNNVLKAFTTLNSIINAIVFLDEKGIKEALPSKLKNSGFTVRLCAKTEETGEKGKFTKYKKWNIHSKQNTVLELLGVENPNPAQLTPRNHKIIALLGLEDGNNFIPSIELPILTLPNPLSMLKSFKLDEAFENYRKNNTGRNSLRGFIKSAEFLNAECNSDNEKNKHIKDNFLKIVNICTSNVPFIKYITIKRNNTDLYATNLQDLTSNNLQILGINIENNSKGEEYTYNNDDYNWQANPLYLDELFNYDSIGSNENASKRLYACPYCFTFPEDFEVGGKIIIKKGSLFTLASNNPTIFKDKSGVNYLDAERIMRKYIELIVNGEEHNITAIGILSPKGTAEQYWDYLLELKEKKRSQTKDNNDILVGSIGNINTAFRVLNSLTRSSEFIDLLKSKSTVFDRVYLEAIRKALLLLNACELEYNKNPDKLLSLGKIMKMKLSEFRDYIHDNPVKINGELVNSAFKFTAYANNQHIFYHPSTKNAASDIKVGTIVKKLLSRFLFLYDIFDLNSTSFDDIRKLFIETLKNDKVDILYHILREGNIKSINVGGNSYNFYTLDAKDGRMNGVSEKNEGRIQTTGKINSYGMFGDVMNLFKLFEDSLKSIDRRSKLAQKTDEEYTGTHSKPKQEMKFTLIGNKMCLEHNGSLYFKENGDFYKASILDLQQSYTIYYSIKDNDGLTTEQKNELSKLNSNVLESNNDYIIIEDENIINNMYDIYNETKSNELRKLLRNVLESIIFIDSDTQNILKRNLSFIKIVNQNYSLYMIEDIKSIVQGKDNFKDLMIVPLENDYYIILPSGDNILLGHSLTPDSIEELSIKLFVENYSDLAKSIEQYGENWLTEKIKSINLFSTEDLNQIFELIYNKWKNIQEKFKEDQDKLQELLKFNKYFESVEKIKNTGKITINRIITKLGQLSFKKDIKDLIDNLNTLYKNKCLNVL